MNFFLDTFIAENYFDEKSVRDYRLKLRYNELVFSDLTAKEAREICSNEFYLSDKTIQKIIYDLGKKKEMPADKKTGITRH